MPITLFLEGTKIILLSILRFSLSPCGFIHIVTKTENNSFSLNHPINNGIVNVYYVQDIYGRPSRHNNENELCFLYQEGLSLIKHQMQCNEMCFIEEVSTSIKRTEIVIDLIYWLRRNLIVTIILEIKFWVWIRIHTVGGKCHFFK